MFDVFGSGQRQHPTPAQRPGVDPEEGEALPPKKRLARLRHQQKRKAKKKEEKAKKEEKDEMEIMRKEEEKVMKESDADSSSPTKEELMKIWRENLETFNLFVEEENLRIKDTHFQ